MWESGWQVRVGYFILETSVQEVGGREPFLKIEARVFCSYLRALPEGPERFP